MDPSVVTGSLTRTYNLIQLGADAGACFCCFVIYITLLTFVSQRPDTPFRGVLRTFSLLALLSGTGKGFEVINYWWTVGQFLSVIKFITLCIFVIACARLHMMLSILPALKNLLELEEEIKKFQAIELKLKLEIERRVRLETALTSSNRNLNSQLAYREQLEAKLREIEMRCSLDREHSPATQSAVDRLEGISQTLSAMTPVNGSSGSRS